MQATPEKKYRPLSAAEKRENSRATKLRLVAYEQGRVLIKSNRAKFRGLGYGVYHLVDIADRKCAGASPTYLIDEVETLLGLTAADRPVRRPEDAAWRTQKICCVCGVMKPLDEFYKHKNSKDGHQGTCAVCSRVRHALYFSKNKAKLNERSRRNQQKLRAEDPTYCARNRLRNHFRMTLEEYETKLAAQGGVCAICGSPPGVKRLAVDHDHDCCPAGKSCGRCVRDLLCYRCNSGTGIADDPELLRRRASYVEEWRVRHGRLTQVA